MVCGFEGVFGDVGLRLGLISLKIGWLISLAIQIILLRI